MFVLTVLLTNVVSKGLVSDDSLFAAAPLSVIFIGTVAAATLAAAALRPNWYVTLARPPPPPPPSPKFAWA